MGLSETKYNYEEAITIKTPKSKLAPKLTENPQGFLPVLQNSRFLVLWGGQIFSQLADKVYLVLTIAIIASSFQIP